MCLSRCSSLVNDCPQYVQNTIVELQSVQRIDNEGKHRY
jgi:hypothetical protein